MQTTQSVERLTEVITLGDGSVWNLRTYVVELLAVADDSECRGLSREGTLGILNLHAIDGEVITVDTILQV